MKRFVKVLLVIYILLFAFTPVKTVQAAPRPMYNKCVKANSKTGWCIVINKSSHQAVIFRKQGRTWKQYSTYYVTVGKNGITRSGTFTTGKKKYYMDFVGSTGFYVTYLRGGASGYIHSTLYKKGSRNISTAKVLDNRLSMNLSKGCVRFSRWGAYFIYYYIPSGTKVVIY